ncbi:MAG: endonuclease/exonuclease/phosphatase family protein [Bacteroidales bacterium]|nr:endonuclease/exonuclease/phosphatase family protein [Bacteroidales bacterium]
MKRILIGFLLMFSITCTLTAQDSLKILTYNIRLDTPVDGQNAWEFRKDSVGVFLRETKADVIGLQEVEHNQLIDIQNALPNYVYVGVGRSDGYQKGEFSPVFFRTSKLELLNSGTFWLSETPEVAGSKGWDAACERICSWASLRSKISGDTLFAFNTHFDHIGVQARFKSARLILKRIDLIAGNHAVVLMGDFNSTTDETAYQRLAGDSITNLTDSRKTYQNDSLEYEITFTGFDQNPENDKLIDFIFINGQFKSLSYAVKKINDRNFYFSDHLPVYSEIQLIK